MSSFLKDNKLNFHQARYHKPSCTESDITTENSVLDGISSAGMDINSLNSTILKENFDSMNSTNNITFADFVGKKQNKR